MVHTSLSGCQLLAKDAFAWTKKAGHGCGRLGQAESSIAYDRETLLLLSLSAASSNGFPRSTPSVPLSLSFENCAPLTIPVPERQTQWDEGSKCQKKDFFSLIKWQWACSVSMFPKLLCLITRRSNRNTAKISHQRPNKETETFSVQRPKSRF